MKLLTLDIEMMPNLAHVWDLRNNHYIAPNQVMEYSHFACAAWKWFDSPTVQFCVADRYQEFMPGADSTATLWSDLDVADVVMTFNGKKFDMPRLNSEFIENGFAPYSPIQQIDLYLAMRKQFWWPSMKLDEICKILINDQKRPHEGHNLWVRCMNGDLEAWKIFREYNEQDVILTEDLYKKVQGWIPNHPNVLLFGEDPSILACPRCHSTHYQKRGFLAKLSGTYRKYQCQECKGWFSDKKRIDGAIVG